MSRCAPPIRASILLAAWLLGISLCPFPAAGAQPPGLQTPRPAATLARATPLLAEMAPGDVTTVIVRFRGRASLAGVEGLARGQRLAAVAGRLQQTADRSQRAVRAALAGRLASGTHRVIPLWILNGLAVTATPEVIRELARHPDVVEIVPDRIIPGPRLRIAAAHGEDEEVGWNLARVRVPDLWSRGIRGEGIVVASLDSGVSRTHPDLAGRWRGGENSWFDPYGDMAQPGDLSGHGTAVMGLLVGGDASGSAIGMAPDAQWIAARIFDRNHNATTVAIHQAFQWLLNPDGDPDTPDAPHVVCNSWSLAYAGCTLEFQQDLRALRAAGIVPVFAAGNGGPGDATDTSPANNPEAFAVGATDGEDEVYEESSRGPSSCGESVRTFPELAAPGVSVYTASLHASYAYATGTSIAAPHVAGGLALLLSAFPDLTPEEQERALRASAVDIGGDGPDNDSGYGRLDLLAAYRWLCAEKAQDVFIPYVLRAPDGSVPPSYLPLIH